MSEEPDEKEYNRLPVLIIPGFMSSGLQIKKSDRKASWVGERIWINLQSLGFQSLYFGASTVPVRDLDGKVRQEPKAAVAQDAEGSKKETDLEQRQRKFKSEWLEHMILESGMRSEAPGVRIGNIEGLEGVDYLSPGMLTNHVSYVFGPVIEALIEKGGYTRNVNIQAAPYDWRMSPGELERRDQYFSRTIQQVEDMYNANSNTSLVLIGHSLGTKTAHYFINFCLEKKGQAWLDKHVHTYMPVGGPHLGAPKALRSTISGDKMSLDTFLSDEEALSFGRSLGSGPWLLPAQLPKGAPPIAYVQPRGLFEVRFEGLVNVQDLVEDRTAYSRPTTFQLQVVFGAKSQHVSTPFVMKQTVKGKDHVGFESETMYFAAPPQIEGDAKDFQLQVLLREPGLASAKYEQEEEKKKGSCCCCFLKLITCCWIFDCLLRIFAGLVKVTYQGFLLSADVLFSSAGGSSVLAFSEPFALDQSVWSGKSEPTALTVTMKHKDDHGSKESGMMCFFKSLVSQRETTVRLHVKFTPYNPPTDQPHLCSAIGELNEPCDMKISRKGDKAATYEAYSGYDMIDREGLSGMLTNIKSLYDDETTLDPRGKSSVDAPPVKRVHAIYGINLPTEVGAIYKRRDLCTSESRLQNLYKLDKKAQVPRDSGYKASGGALLETKEAHQPCVDGKQVSGDGTVPYWSLHHVHTWKGQCEHVSVLELDKAEHREILADVRFHEAVIDYCRQEVMSA